MKFSLLHFVSDALVEKLQHVNDVLQPVFEEYNMPVQASKVQNRIRKLLSEQNDFHPSNRLQKELGITKKVNLDLPTIHRWLLLILSETNDDDYPNKYLNK